MKNEMQPLEKPCPQVDHLLNELQTLQKQLLEDGAATSPAAQPAEERESRNPDSFEIATASLDREIDSEYQSHSVFSEAQHHLFETPKAQPEIDEALINSIVNRLMARLRSKFELLLREKIRTRVIARFYADHR